MKSNKSSQKFSGLIGVTAIALCLAACGGEQSLKGDSGSAQANQANSVRSTSNGNSGLALQLPESLPKGVDTVVVNLTSDSCYSNDPFGVMFGAKGTKGLSNELSLADRKKETNANVASNSTDTGVFCANDWEFSLKDPSSAKDGSIALNDLEPGNYSISIALINGKTGKVYEQGAGKVVIQTGKTAKAEISMSRVVDKTGNLKIVLK